jgi:hypothetical protein
MMTSLKDGTAGRETPRLARRDLVVLLVAAACLQAIAWAALLSLFAAGRMGYGLHELADTLLYQEYATAFSFGHWPYSRVPVEYPPLANLVFLVAPARASVATYEATFGAAMIVATTAAAVLTTAAAALTWRSVPRGLAAGGTYAVLTLCCGALAVNRYDAVVALTVAAAMLFLALRRPLGAGVSLGLGFALKLTPALLLPLLLLVQESRRRVLATSIAFLLAAALPFVPVLLHDPGSMTYPFTYHADRPLQLESVLGTPWAAAALAGTARPRIVHAFGSQNFSGQGPDALAGASPWLLILAVSAVYLLAWWRRGLLREHPELLPVAALAVLLVAICTSKVLSPQFLIWTFPVVALCVAQKRLLPKLAALAVAVAVALTQLEFPARYWDLVDLQPAPLALLVARNAVLLLAAAAAIAALVRIPPDAPDDAELHASAESGDGARPVTSRS